MQTLIIAIIVAFLLATFKKPLENFFITLFSHGNLRNMNEYIGKRGEDLINNELSRLDLPGLSGMTLNNLYIPKGDGSTTEIDLVFITEKGIFVIESKNYSGWIFGNENDQYWTATLPNGQKNRFYNPVKQNRSHIRWLKNYLQMDPPIYSLIIFSDRCELKQINCYSSDMSVIHRKDMASEINRVMYQSPNFYSPTETEQIYNRLLPLTHTDREMRDTHIAALEQPPAGAYANTKVYAQPVVRPNSPAVQQMICPKCGGKLILRTAKRGNHVGNKFYGCSNYPKCKYIQNI